jgi:hypothetical protein
MIEYATLVFATPAFAKKAKKRLLTLTDFDASKCRIGGDWKILILDIRTRQIA